MRSIKANIVRGLVALIPLGLTVLLVRFLYNFVDRKVASPLETYLGVKLPGVGLLVVLILLFLIGLLVRNVVGRELLALVEKIFAKVPLLNSAYQVGKQLSDTLSLPEKAVFRKAVLVEYLKPGMWTIGFVTGYLRDNSSDGEKLLKVFIPTPPNPLSGTMVIVKEEQVRDPGWTIEEATKAVISGGIIGPEDIK